MSRNTGAGKGRNSKIMCYDNEFAKNYAIIKALPTVDSAKELFYNGFTIEELVVINKFKDFVEQIKLFKHENNTTTT